MPDPVSEADAAEIAPRDPLAGLSLDDASIPAALRASVDRYRLNMDLMVAALRGAALGEAQIEAGVRALAESYRAELMTAMDLLRDISLRDTGMCLQ